MKISLVLNLLCVFAISANSFSQNESLTLDIKKTSVKDVFKTIEGQTSYRFFYNDDLSDIDRQVDVLVHDSGIGELLDQLFANTGISYTILDNNLIVVAPTRSLQQHRITGKVTDATTGEPLTGVYVMLKGTSTGAVTDVNGRYSVDVTGADAVLIFSFVGYNSEEVPVGGRSIIDVALVVDIQALDEVVVIGYGTQKKSDITGAVTSVKSEDITKLATSSPIAAIQGRAAGVSVVQESGSPDASTSIKIRGVGTPNDASPLYVVDGFPMSDINYLNPSDIASMEILKDASACAIYGSRGANGVILITTKKGQKGVLKVNINAYYGLESLAQKPELLNSKQYAALTNEAYVNAGKDPLYNDVNNIAYNTDWYDEVSRIGKVQSYNISITGGSEKMTSLLSATYYKNEGIIKSTDYDKLSLVQNNTMKVTRFFDIETSLSAAFTRYKNLDATSIFLSSLIAPPDIPVINPETGYYSGITKIRLMNPAGRIARNNDQNRRTYLVGNINATLNITKDLAFNSRFGARYDGTYNSGFSPVYYETMDNSETINTVRRSSSKMIDWTWENILTYHKNFNDVHDITLMGAMSAREYNYDGYSVTKQNVPIDKDEFWYFDSATENPQASGNGRSLAMISYLGRLNYSFKNRYLLTASIRSDGSSRFIGDNRWGVFPSGAFAWKLSEEEFFKGLNLNWFTSAKVRLGYGELGNENISSYYPYLTPIAQQRYYTLGVGQERINGSSPSGIGNTEAKWEISTQSNVGIDLMFLTGKLSITADYYIRKTDDILLSQQVPVISGSSSMVRNVGGMENKGFEFTVSYKETKGDFSYNIAGNLATVKNKVTSLGTSGSLISSFAYDYVLIDFQGALGNMIRSEVGLPYGQFYGYVTDGIFQNQGEIDTYTKEGVLIQPDARPGDVKFKDINNNGRIDSGDQTFIGSPIPDLTYGLSFDATYKNFDLSLLLQGSIGNDIYNAAKYYFMRFDGRQNIRANYLDEYWHGEGTSNNQPVVTNDVSRNGRNYRNSDFYVEDGSYLRLKTLQIGYNYTPTFASGAKPSFRFYISAQNLLTFTGYSGFEPEVSGISVDRGQYPQARLFMLGTVINF